MGRSDGTADRALRRVSDAFGKKRADETGRSRLESAWTWVLVDANRWLVVAVLAALVYATVVLVGVYGPVSQEGFLLGGVAGGKPYVELQTGMVTVITIVLAINQLVLTPELGPLSRQRQRLENVMSHRTKVEDLADVATTPTEPARFLATVARGTNEAASTLSEAVADVDDAAFRDRFDDVVGDVTEEADRIGDALGGERFGDVEMIGTAMHYDTSHDVSRLRRLERDYADDLSTRQRKAFDDLVDALEVFTVSREFFRTLYVRSQFVRFSRAILYTALPAIVLAHLMVQVVGPNAFPAATFGVRNLLWFVAGAFTLTLLPVFVLVSYVARLVTLAETSLFISPFVPEAGNARPGEGED